MIFPKRLASELGGYINYLLLLSYKIPPKSEMLKTTVSGSRSLESAVSWGCRHLKTGLGLKGPLSLSLALIVFRIQFHAGSGSLPRFLAASWWSFYSPSQEGAWE